MVPGILQRWMARDQRLQDGPFSIQGQDVHQSPKAGQRVDRAHPRGLQRGGSEEGVEWRQGNHP